MLRAIIVFAFLIGSSVIWAQVQQSNTDRISTANSIDLDQLIHSDFKDCLIEPPHPRPRLYAQETYEFTGNADRLNAFLAQTVKLQAHHLTTIYLCGPAQPIVQPLTSVAAQAAVEYDWKVQTLAENISIFIPLASRIPFAEIKFPNELNIEAEPAVQPLTEDFLRLRQQELDDENRPLTPKE